MNQKGIIRKPNMTFGRFTYLNEYFTKERPERAVIKPRIMNLRSVVRIQCYSCKTAIHVNIAMFPRSEVFSSDKRLDLTTKLCPLKNRKPTWSQKLSNFVTMTTMARQAICKKTILEI